MKRFKKIDVWISVGLILASVIWACVCAGHDFLAGYFVVGACQLISMILHAANGWFSEKGSSRYYYHIAVACILGIALIGMVIYTVLFIILLFLLFFAPVMAIWYTCMCYNETYIKMQRPLSLLK